MLFKDRSDAGRQLANRLCRYQDNPEAILLALPRGGVALGYEMSHLLHIPLDIILVRKLGVPRQEELAFGAIAIDGQVILNHSIMATLNIDQETVDAIIASQRAELERRNQLYRRSRPFPDLHDKTVILVDDGIATGASIRAAIKAVQHSLPRTIIVAVPLASNCVLKEMAQEAVEFVVLQTPEPFYGVGMWYDSFPQLSDQEVIDLLPHN